MFPSSPATTAMGSDFPSAGSAVVPRNHMLCRGNMPKILVRTVAELQPDPNGDAFLWDNELRGFGVRMMPSGVATYIVKYRNKEGRQRKLALGRVGALAPEEARRSARKRLAEIADGADPSADRQQLRKSMTISELCDLYLEDAAGRVKGSTLTMDRSRIERHVKPLIGKRTVQSLTATDVAKMQADIISGKTARERPKGRGGATTGGKGVAGRTVGMLGSILELARKRKLVRENVSRGIQRPPEGKQRRFLAPLEIEALGIALREAVIPDQAAAAVRFLLLSGCRRMEVLALPERWLDERASCIRFEDTKSGAQLRPIGASAFAAIKDHGRRDGWVFPAERGEGHFVGLPNVLERLCKRAHLEGVTVHVLRHSYAATAAEMGFSELTIAGPLGHSVPGVTARYAHVADTALVAAANQVSARIAGLLDKQDDADNVVPMRA